MKTPGRRSDFSRNSIPGKNTYLLIIILKLIFEPFIEIKIFAKRSLALKNVLEGQFLILYKFLKYFNTLKNYQIYELFSIISKN